MRRTGTALVFAGTLAALSAAAPDARAEGDDAKLEEDAADARARRLYREGDRAYAEGRYEDAVDKFDAAYRLSQRPLLLYNLGNAYERLGRFDDAIRALRRYLPHADQDETSVIEARIGNLERRAEEARAKAEKEPSDEGAPSPPPPPPERDSPSPPVLGWTLVGVGGVAAGVGTFFALSASGAADDAKRGCTSAAGGTVCSDSAQSDLDREQQMALLADVSFGLAVVALGVGAYLVISSGGDDEGASAQARVGATFRPGGGELSLAGRF